MPGAAGVVGVVGVVEDCEFVLKLFSSEYAPGVVPLYALTFTLYVVPGCNPVNVTLFCVVFPIVLPFTANSYSVAPATISQLIVALLVDGVIFNPVTFPKTSLFGENNISFEYAPYSICSYFCSICFSCLES